MCSNRFLLVYGSQTGQAQAIAEEIQERCGQEGLKADLHCLSKVDKKFSIENEPVVVFIISTTGDGEPPDTALKFWRRVRKRTLPEDAMANVRYTMLGLGDSNYMKFCKCSKTLNKRVLELGAVEFYTCGWADEANGLEEQAEPWIDGLFSALRKELNVEFKDENDLFRDVVTHSNLTKQIIRNVDDMSLEEMNFNKGDTNATPRETDAFDMPDTAPAVVVASTTLPTSQSDVQLISIKTASMDLTSKPDTTTTTANNHLVSGDSRLTSIIGNSTPLTPPQSPVSPTNSSTTTTSPVLESTQPPVIPQPADLTTPPSTPSSPSTTSPPSFPHTSPLREHLRLLVEPSMPASSKLSVPVMSPRYLNFDFTATPTPTIYDLQRPQNDLAIPSCVSEIFLAPVVDVCRLNPASSSHKKTYLWTLDIQGSDIVYEPGDTIGVVCKNCEQEVESLLNKFDVSPLQSKQSFRLSIDPNTTKKTKPRLPPHVPDSASLYDVLLYCLDIRAVPKKAFLRILAEYCTDNIDQKRRLLEYTSKQGTEMYSNYIRKPLICLLDILNAFDSCKPPISLIFEHLPRLLPRPYSVSSSQLCSPGEVSFVLNTIEFDHQDGRSAARFGVCSGQLHRMQSTGIKQGDKLAIFLRRPTNFRLPVDPEKPLILIGPGTGVAPFIGFLRHRRAQRNDDSAIKYGETRLYFGCRTNKDFLFREELQGFVDDGILSKLSVAFSRDSTTKQYVQDKLEEDRDELVDFLTSQQGAVMVCGDAAGMAKDVCRTVKQMLAEGMQWDSARADEFIEELVKQRRYVEDIWT